METIILLKLLKHWLLAEATAFAQIINRLENEGDYDKMHELEGRHEAYMDVVNVISNLLNKEV